MQGINVVYLYTCTYVYCMQTDLFIAHRFIFFSIVTTSITILLSL